MWTSAAATEATLLSAAKYATPAQPEMLAQLPQAI